MPVKHMSKTLVELLPVISARSSIDDLLAVFSQSPKLNAVLIEAEAPEMGFGLLCKSDLLLPVAQSSQQPLHTIARFGLPRCEGKEGLRQLVKYGPEAFESGVIYYENGKAVGIITPLRLATILVSRRACLEKERDDARRALSKALEQRMSYLAHMGHELRAPLNSILGFSDMMREKVHGPLGDQHYDDYAQNIHQAGCHLLDVINVVLDMAKVKSGFVELHSTRVGLNDLCVASVEILKAQARSKNIEVRVKVPVNIPKLLVDPQLFRQILINLLSNAIKFSPQNSVIVLSAKIDAKGFLRLIVADQGPGIDAGDIERVMKPFRQARGAKASEGTGLGLPYVKSLCELHDGSFQLLSEKGQGTRAIITLPPSRVHGFTPSGQCEFIFSRPA